MITNHIYQITIPQVRHLLIKGKEASKYDFMNVLPDFKEAIEQATKVLNDLQKLNLNTNYNCKDGRITKSRRVKNLSMKRRFHFRSNLARTFTSSACIGPNWFVSSSVAMTTNTLCF